MRFNNHPLPELFHRIIKQIIRKKAANALVLKFSFRFYFEFFNLLGISFIRQETIDLISVGFQMGIFDANWLMEKDLENLETFDFYSEDPLKYQSSFQKLKSLWIISKAQLNEYEDFEYNLNLILED